MITKTIILKTSFGILFGPKAFLFKRPLISLLISSFKTIGLILNTLCFVVASISILLKSIIPILGKNFAVKIFNTK